MNIIYPANCDTTGKKMAFLERLKKKVILLHNGMGKWHGEGLTEIQYNKLPLKVKNIFPYKPQLSTSDYDKFKNGIYRKLLNVYHDKLGEERNLAREDENTWNPDIDGDINGN